ncbi:type I-C CRISPR-associated protein Cas8c/Csd1 [Opitutales bacterium ASA1]|uniref:type I-C CRISPR-associated protein Cas8c/Csd1 n=1 Tax=Congregicoccus parvus TaxID=3081749 RepID=UPI002B323556|nr:type I-C CRISPR-associated protein Cas8c/Csd1 [Opitutales bacterium ASA1]
MLLKHLYDFAVSRKLLDDLAFSSKAVRWIIELDRHGELVGTGPQIAGDDKRGKEFSCPQTTRPKVAGGVSEFLADGLTAVFGLDTDPDASMSESKRADRDANNLAKRTDFWAQIESARRAAPSEEIDAVAAFGSRLATQPPAFLRWGRATDGRSEKSAWWITTAGGVEIRLGPENFTFRVNGNLLLEDEALREFWRNTHAREVADAREGYRSGLCLVTGSHNQKLAPTHNPKIQGVPNTQSFGAAIVSFDKPAFGSYGFDQSLNSPTSDEAATAYCVALNHLIQRNDHSVRIGQTCLCFWAAHTPIEQTPFAFLNRPDPKAVRDFIRAPFAGIERELVLRDRFFAVTLAGNSGRIVVRHWLQATVEQAIENLQHWFADLAIDVPPRPPRKTKPGGKEKDFHPLSIYWLACTTVREAKDLPADVPAQLYRAALEGTAPSVALLKPILDQLHSRLLRDENYQLVFDESRFALLKLILNRQPDRPMEIKTSVTADTDDAAYNCGRLLAILAATQDKAHEFKLEGPGVAERYFGTAGVSPASVFPLLLRLNRHHLNKISKSERFGGHEHFIQQQIEAVLALFKPPQPGRPPAFPRTLDLQSQGRFALGFYQQSAADAAARQTNKKDAEPAAAAS